MKILQLGKFYPIRGGVEKVMWDLTRGLSERGVQCDMLCAKLASDGPDPADRQRCVNDGDIDYIRFNPNGRVICVRAVTKAAATMISPAMIGWLRRHRREYDIIHVHHPDPMAALALRLSGFKGKVVLHWHSDILKQKGLLKLYLPLQKWIIRRADRIVGTTPVYVKASPYLKDVQRKVTYLPIGVRKMPQASSSRNVYAQEKGRKVIFSLGRLVEYKGYRFLVEATRHLTPDYAIVIGGDGPLREDLQKRIDALKRESSERVAKGLKGYASVRLAGRISDSDLPSYFAGCDVFALSSIWKTEAFAIVQVEAMSCGKPVVATRIPGSGVSWVNEDGVSGLNVPVEDAGAIADAVLKICRDELSYAQYSKGARGRFESRFRYETMIDNCLEIYEKI